ncbi:VOC family protein [Salinimicrobium sp. HB62]|uniref:VOC family protein n=1 Tax=Salinimicrobium sp. HB62 TaxID=3077781 RepID=UPI002D76C570|nr:VOC family protein [Salinimicrobium sp. HB62]
MAYSLSFNHIALSVKDVDESVEFYQKLLKLEEIKNTASDSKTRWLSLNEEKQLHLIPRPDSEIKINKAVHFALSTPNLDPIISKLEKLKIEFYDWKDNRNKIHVRKDGIKQIYFQDPNGYWIEINNDVK